MWATLICLLITWRKTHRVALKGIEKVPNQKVTRRPKCFSFFFFFFFRRASSNLRNSFTMVFAQNSSIFTEQCTSISLLSRFEVTRGDSNRSLKNYGFLYDAIFSSRVRICTNHLATKCNYYARLLVCGECSKKAWSGQWFFSQYCIGNLWGETCCSITDGKLQLKYASAAKKKWHEQE